MDELGVMAHDNNARPIQRRNPAELRERAVRLVLETIAERGDRHGAMTRDAQQLSVGSESLRLWVRQLRSTAVSAAA